MAGLGAVLWGMAKWLERQEEDGRKREAGRPSAALTLQLGRVLFHATDMIDGVLVDPALPVGLDATDHLSRGEYYALDGESAHLSSGLMKWALWSER